MDAVIEAQEYNQKGIAAYDAGNMEEAKTLFAAAIEKDPKFVDARRNYGEVLLELEDYENGIQTFVGILNDHGNDLLTLLRLAQLYSEVGKEDDAIILAEKVIELDPRNVEAKALLSNIAGDGAVETGANEDATVGANNIGLIPEETPSLEPVSIQFKNNAAGAIIADIDDSPDENIVTGRESAEAEDLSAKLMSDKVKDIELTQQNQSFGDNPLVDLSSRDLTLSRFSTTKFFKRKAKNRDTVMLKGVVEEDGDCYVIDLDPCVHGWVFHIEKKFVEIKPTQSTICLPDGEEAPIYFISVKKGSPMIKLEYCDTNDLEHFAYKDGGIRSLNTDGE